MRQGSEKTVSLVSCNSQETATIDPLSSASYVTIKRVSPLRGRKRVDPSATHQDGCEGRLMGCEVCLGSPSTKVTQPVWSTCDFDTALEERSTSITLCDRMNWRCWLTLTAAIIWRRFIINISSLFSIISNRYQSFQRELERCTWFVTDSSMSLHVYMVPRGLHSVTWLLPTLSAFFLCADTPRPVLDSSSSQRSRTAENHVHLWLLQAVITPQPQSWLLELRQLWWASSSATRCETDRDPRGPGPANIYTCSRFVPSTDGVVTFVDVVDNF